MPYLNRVFYPFVLTTFNILIAVLALLNSTTPSFSDVPNVKVQMLDKARSYTSTIISDDLVAPINKIISDLTEKNIVTAAGDDAQVRPTYVTTQGLIERSLAEILVDNPNYYALAIFHTPAPPTPFCLGSENPEALMHVSIAANQASKNTVISRQETMKNLLEKGVVIVNVFPYSGQNKRTSIQLENYKKIKSTYPDNFFDIKIGVDISKNQIGATYLIKAQTGDWYVFAIQSSQANAPKQEAGQWEMVVGKLNDKDVHAFFNKKMDYLSDITAGKINNFSNKFFQSANAYK